MAKNPRIKRSGVELEFTYEEILELKKCAEDPVYFIKKYVKIQHPKLGSIPFELYGYQERLVLSYKDNRFNIVLSARQTGKSATSAAFLLWYSIFNKNKTVLIASNKNANAMEMIHRIRFAYEELPLWLKPGVTEDGWNKHSVAFENGTRIISTATSEDSGRGLAISLLYLDEFAFVKPNIQDEFWTSILPTLSTGGSCIITSTPNGDANRFAMLWRSAEVGVLNDDILFVPTRVRWDEPPGRDDTFKRQMIGAIGELMWRQEYECEFLSSDALLIDTMAVEIITKQAKKHIGVRNEIIFWDNIKEGQTYLVSVDPATGAGKDFGVIEAFHFPSLEQIAEYRSNTMDSNKMYLKLSWLLKAFESKHCTVYFTVENNGVGEGMIALYQNDENVSETAEFVCEEGKSRLGMTTTGPSKLKACLSFKQLVEKSKMTIHSPILIKEIKTYVRRQGSYNAQVGSTDDCIAATLLIVRMINEIASYEQDAFDKLYTIDQSDIHEGFEDFNDTEYDENEEPDPLIM